MTHAQKSLSLEDSIFRYLILISFHIQTSMLQEAHAGSSYKVHKMSDEDTKKYKCLFRLNRLQPQNSRTGRVHAQQYKYRIAYWHGWIPNSLKGI